MPKITHKQAKKFLDTINEKDNVVMIHHDDLDGFSSGIIFRSFCEKKGAKVKNIPFTIGSNQKNVIKQTKGFNKVIISDLSPNTIIQILNSLDDKEVLYTDHHQETTEKYSRKIKEYRTIDQGYIPSSRTAYELTKELYWLAVCGTLGDAGHKYAENKVFLDHFFSPKDMSLEVFEKEIVFTLNNVLIYFEGKNQKLLKKLLALNTYKDVKKLKKYARPVEKEIKKHYKNFKKNHEKMGPIQFYIFEPKYSVKSVVTTKISLENPKGIYLIGAIEKSRIRFSARNSSREYNMINVLQAGIKGLQNANGGGHIAAAGGEINKKDLEQFKENLRNYKLE